MCRELRLRLRLRLKLRLRLGQGWMTSISTTEQSAIYRFDVKWAENVFGSNLVVGEEKRGISGQKVSRLMYVKYWK